MSRPHCSSGRNSFLSYAGCLPLQTEVGGIRERLPGLRSRTSVSSRQQEFLRDMETQGYKVALCHGFDEAKAVICHYVGIKNGD